MESDDPAGELLTKLTDLELRVARRADELARAGLAATPLKVGCWFQAEQEILDPAWFEPSFTAKVAEGRLPQWRKL